LTDVINHCVIRKVWVTRKVNTALLGCRQVLIGTPWMDHFSPPLDKWASNTVLQLYKAFHLCH